MLYELRIYHMHPGRMEAIHRRFTDHSMKLLAKHGMKVLDFWENADGENKLYYVVEHRDRPTRDKSWADFVADPAWQEVKRLSELDGPIVERVDTIFMNRVPYSPVKS